MSSLCGGVISQTQADKDMKKYGVWANAMCDILPDVQYKKYVAFHKAGKPKEATKIFEKYAISQI